MLAGRRAGGQAGGHAGGQAGREGRLAGGQTDQCRLTYIYCIYIYIYIDYSMSDLCSQIIR